MALLPKGLWVCQVHRGYQLVQNSLHRKFRISAFPFFRHYDYWCCSSAHVFIPKKLHLLPQYFPHTSIRPVAFISPTFLSSAFPDWRRKMEDLACSPPLLCSRNFFLKSLPHPFPARKCPTVVGFLVPLIIEVVVLSILTGLQVQAFYRSGKPVFRRFLRMGTWIPSVVPYRC